MTTVTTSSSRSLYQEARRLSMTLFLSIPLVAATVFLGAAAAFATGPTAVSPGSSTGSLIGDACPTFSWGQVPGADGYELVVYSAADLNEEGSQPVIEQQVAGSASSWTPSLDRCIERGGRYAWSIRALGTEVHTEWSIPILFEVAAGPSKSDFEQALAVVREYLAVQEPLVAARQQTTRTARRESPSPSSVLQGGGAESLGEGDLPVSMVLDGAFGIGASAPQADLHIVAVDPSQAGRIVVAPSDPGLEGPSGVASVHLSDDPNVENSSGFSMVLDPSGTSGAEGLTFWETDGELPLRAKINIPSGAGAGVNFLEKATFFNEIHALAGIDGFSPGPHTVDTTCHGLNCDGSNFSGVDAATLGGFSPSAFSQGPHTPLALVAKGDVLVHDGTAVVRVPMGKAGQVMMGDSNAPTGLAWHDMMGPYGDEFTLLGKYDGSNGAADWKSSQWVEDDADAGQAGGGLIRVVTEPSCASGNCMRFEVNSEGDNVFREMDLVITGCTAAELSVFVNNQLGSWETLTLEVSGDGGSNYTPLKDYDDSNNGAYTDTFDITSFIAVDTRIRMRVVDGDEQFIFFDNVKIYC